MKHKAIYELYSTVKSIKEIDGTIVAYDENSNEVSLDMSAIDTKADELRTADDNAKTQKETDKVSAKAKLIAGEALTEAEADTIVL
jgi:small nuclear ribonucleoprotein (snRNP)-like protein